MLGQTISHYRVIQKIGGGGMGVVYEAEDTRLGRHVALKFLPEQASRDRQALERFLREARAASALNHPHICTIYDIGESEPSGRHFLAMELLDGKTLKDRIGGQPLPIDTIVELGEQIAGALEAAHAKGIVHRDIKPSNLFVLASGHAKVLDFGLAKLAAPEGGAGAAASDVETALADGNLTDPGQAVGTVAYMSPEQARGETVDARTDVFSLGAVLYEMATGRQAFAGSSTAVVFEAILNRTPASPVRANPDVPDELDRIIHKALEKARELRYQSAADLRSDLRRLRRDSDASQPVVAGPSEAGSATTPPPVTAADTGSSDSVVAAALVKRHKGLLAGVGAAVVIAVLAGAYGVSRLGTPAVGESIDAVAVLPFENVSGDPDTEYLSDGIAETLINDLSNLPNLRVVPRGMAFAYKGRAVDLQTIGDELDVRAVITGRVTQRGDTLVIGAELTDVAAVAQLWGEQYTRPQADIFALQADITGAIARNLRPALTGEEETRLAERGTEDQEAYELYLRGQFHFGQLTLDSLRNALEYFEQAIARDPSYAAPHAWAAVVYAMLGSFGALPPAAAYPQARAAALEALELDETLSGAHTALAVVKLYADWDVGGAEQSIGRAQELDPNNTWGHMMAGALHVIGGRPEEAIAAARRARDLEPLSPLMNGNLGETLWLAGRYEAAVDQAQATLDLDPGFPNTHGVLWEIYLELGRYDEALLALETFESGIGQLPLFDGFRAVTYARMGRGEDARSLVPALEDAASQGAPLSLFLAAVYTFLGEADRAFDWLEVAFERHDAQLVVVGVMPWFDTLHDDPRFTDLLDRIGLPR